MTRMGTFLFLVVALLACSTGVADELILTDGSHVKGMLGRVQEGKVTFKSETLGDLTLEVAKIKGIVTDNPVNVKTKAGDVTVGKLGVGADGTQQVTRPGQAAQAAPLAGVSDVWPAAADSPELVAAKSAYEKARAKWTMRLELGINGETGNTDRVAVNGGLKINRTTDKDRLLIYAQGRFAHENGEDTVREIFGGAKLEVDLNDRLFAFGNLYLENDKFENLKLRTNLTGGLGYFIIKEETQELKVRGGAGLRFESYDDGTNTTGAVLEGGVDYRVDITPWLRFVHGTTIYPTVDDFGDFRLMVENAGEIPLSNKENWKLRLGVRNAYDSMPQPGIKRLDTFYFLNVVWDWQ
jgi:putative salt-induced outer membrane protein YdiY